ncbi:hypothetical protein [Mycolicibacter hiberniae]|uniref:Uncharacterized protein n=1 Tax=Mycolicibacter hiberniae TaxID=29314 RepID=A0A7I7WYB3_9MYCO|nr:hypothetical protein [Mycolicibacter hiberniae]MCV7086561.1 hypothetical protein [Mycolicibacter hiberniae]ORV69939.1 hypothetical protein AWC09_11025 [Mycolicibacter hiberniae]BBZ22140.1 hypothetical protein MHIB_05580 [Mycolicibacter hiberniae]
MTDPRPELAGRADFLRLAGQLHSGDQEGIDAVLANLADQPAGYAVALVEAGLREYLVALRAMTPDPEVAQRWLDATGLEALDRLRDTD